MKESPDFLDLGKRQADFTSNQQCQPPLKRDKEKVKEIECDIGTIFSSWKDKKKKTSNKSNPFLKRHI